MRFFLNDKTGDELTQADIKFNKGYLTQEFIPLWMEWKNKDGNGFKAPSKKLIQTLDNGSKIYEEIDNNEQGEWIFYSMRTGEKEYIEKEKLDIILQENYDKSLTHELKEQINIYHQFTPEEQDEYDKKEKERQEQEKKRKEHQSYLDNIEMTVEGLRQYAEGVNTKVEQNNDDTAQAIVELYKLIIPTLTDSTDESDSGREYIAKMYARLIKRGIITIDDVPADLVEEVKKWL